MITRKDLEVKVLKLEEDKVFLEGKLTETDGKLDAIIARLVALESTPE